MGTDNKASQLSLDGKRVDAIVRSDRAHSGHTSFQSFLSGFVKPATLDIDHLPPSAWTEHLHFLVCLINYLSPKRYVELGAHYGCSFFAACQAAKTMGNKTECIAIDTWEGDDHAGYYDESVFSGVVRVLEKDFPECARYIRAEFDRAAEQFAPGSIDLLHIDGLHTYEAVKNDFEKWLPKMTTDGVILFHDTFVFERGFGVHKFWDEVRGRYPSFCFEHGYGLGVLYVGSDTNSEAASMFRAVGQPGGEGAMRSIFASIGRRSTEKQASTQMISALNAEINVLREHEATLHQIYSSRGWKALQIYYKIRDSILRAVGLKK